VRPARVATTATWGLDSGGDGLNWRMKGACHDGWDPNLWTSHSGGDRGQAAWICRHLCEVRAQCAAWARDNPRQARGAVYGGYWWTSRREAGPVHAGRIAEHRPTGEPAADTGDPTPRPTPASDAERIAWLWAAGVPLVDIVKRIGCTGQDVARRIAELQQATGRARPDTSHCGTPKGYSRHRRRREPACTPCNAANAAAKADRARRAAA
jgi:hypothetical protein